MLLHGILSVFNTVVPAVVYWAWIYPKDDAIVSPSNYRVAWRYYWISNVTMWFIPAILWPITATDSDVPKYLFVNWFNWTYGPLWGAWAATAVWFMNSVKNKNWEYIMDSSKGEIWAVVVTFFVVSATNVILRLVYESDLKEWYPYSWSETRDSNSNAADFIATDVWAGY